ncbi:hypothetical protein AN960_20925 [Bacillus sp. FJAT-25509]|uniref:hypothetical protein n=1 Tax=Bacillus sp. FJAT-25509 TaxID=1712029 RepID=UPI000700CE5F|nr:hypothetical protein [Bacillus sp. FJAT-25509]KQL33539.1 hypothetical protein AN960_20925 [Bacillus sp. FJAT-25509]
MAIGAATHNGVLDGRIKRLKQVNEDEVSTEVIIVDVNETGEVGYFVDRGVHNILKLIGPELNPNSVEIINGVHKQYGFRNLLDSMYAISNSVGTVDNPTGYMLKMLPIKANEFSKRAS